MNGKKQLNVHHYLYDNVWMTFLWFLHAPMMSLLYLFCRLASMFAIGFSGSQFLSQHADQIYEEIRSSYLGAESFEIRERRLIRAYESNMSLYTETQREVIDEGIRISRTYKTMDCVKRLESLLRMPLKLRQFDPEIDGLALKKMLTETNCGDDIALAVYRYIAIMATCYKYELDVTIKSPFLLGPPGTGKTRLVRKVAEVLQLPYLSVPLNEVHCMDQLFGLKLMGYHPNTNGIISEFMSNQTNVHGELLKENIYPIILCFEEIEKHLTGSYCFKTSFLRLVNTEDGATIKIGGLNDLHVPRNRFMFWFDANNEVKNTVPVTKEEQGVDPFMDRMDVMRFPAFTKGQKFVIANDIVRNVLKQSNGLIKQSLELQKQIATIVEEDKEEGVRQLKNNVLMAVITELAYHDGWTHYPLLKSK